MSKYLRGKLSAGFVSLYSSRVILNVASNLIGLFFPIFLYEFFELNIIYVVMYYVIRNVLYGVLIPINCRFVMNKIGLKNSIMTAVFWGAAFYFALYLLDSQRGHLDWTWNNWTMWIIIASILINVIFRLMYWVPVHTDITRFTNKRDRAKQLSLFEVVRVILAAIMPLVAGWILLRYQYDVLFVIAIVVYLSGLIPLLALPKTKVTFSWTCRKTWKEFLSKKRRKLMMAYAGDGAEGLVGKLIWPIFIWELLNGNYFQVGLLSSLIVAVTIIFQLLVGRLADKGNKQKILRYGSVFYALGWVVKIFIATAFQIFITSTYHNLARIFTRTSFDTLNYDLAADQGRYVDEYTAIREMAIVLGRLMMLALILILLPYFSIQWTFILAALASLAMNYISEFTEEIDTQSEA